MRKERDGQERELRKERAKHKTKGCLRKDEDTGGSKKKNG